MSATSSPNINGTSAGSVPPPALSIEEIKVGEPNDAVSASAELRHQTKEGILTEPALRQVEVARLPSEGSAQALEKVIGQLEETSKALENSNEAIQQGVQQKAAKGEAFETAQQTAPKQEHLLPQEERYEKSASSTAPGGAVFQFFKEQQTDNLGIRQSPGKIFRSRFESTLDAKIKSIQRQVVDPQKSFDFISKLEQVSANLTSLGEAATPNQQDALINSMIEALALIEVGRDALNGEIKKTTGEAFSFFVRGNLTSEQAEQSLAHLTDTILRLNELVGSGKKGAILPELAQFQKAVQDMSYLFLRSVNKEKAADPKLQAEIKKMLPRLKEVSNAVLASTFRRLGLWLRAAFSEIGHWINKHDVIGKIKTVAKWVAIALVGVIAVSAALALTIAILKFFIVLPPILLTIAGLISGIAGILSVFGLFTNKLPGENKLLTFDNPFGSHRVENKGRA